MLSEDPQDLLVFHQPLGILAPAGEIITEELKCRAIFLLSLTPEA